MEDDPKPSLFRMGSEDFLRYVGENQAAGGVVARAGKDGDDFPLFHDGALIQNGHAVADFLHHRHLMGDEDHRNAQLSIDVPNQLQNGVGGFGVQGAGGLVA